ncbi:MAG: hypothetical protein JNJ83_08825 [Verrucomicrobiaceae bacterium]|nr:hypothetical protein [Verrucomicrobiaceae bacterium]
MSTQAKATQAALPLPPALEAKLAEFRRRVWLVKLTEGILAAFFGLALSYAIVFALDRFMETPAALRLAILLSGSIGLGLVLPLKWHRWVWQQRRLEDAARLLRRTFPRLGDQLLGIVQLARMNDDSARSESLVLAAMNQAAESVKDADFSHAVPNDSHRPWAWTAGSAVAIAAAAFFLVPAAAWNALARWITPWREVERYTFAKVEQLPERMVVPYAEPFDLNAKLRQDTEWSPESGKARIVGQPDVRAANQSQSFGFSLPPQKTEAQMKLSIGDVRKTVEVVPTERPEMKTLTAEVTLPDYLQYKTKPKVEARGGSVTLLDEANASFQLTASRNLSTGEVNGQKANVEGEKLITSSAKVEKSHELKFTWKDVDGLTAKEPLVLKIQAVQDEAPSVIARRESQEQVFLDTDVLSFDIDAADDFGVKQVGIEWRPLENPQGKTGEKIASAGAAETKTVTARATFSAQKEGVAPQALEIRAWAEDYKPGRERARSPGFVVHILSKDDHAIWMTDQFGKWLQAARETYEHEQRLHETNKELRELTEQELDRPENRRRLSQQAAAEEANRDRLDSLNGVGRKLIEQAARNDSFDAARLETWATMLRQLKDIAGNRMPTVADMLKKSAGAPSNAPKGSVRDQMRQQQKQMSAALQSQGQKNSASSSSQSSADQKPPQEQIPSAPQKSGPEAPRIAQGEQSSSEAKKPSEMDPKAPALPKAPTLADNEKSYLKPGEKQPEEDKPGAPKKPSSGKLSLPNTTLGAAPSKPGDKPQEQQPQQQDSPARQDLDKALAAQQQLLAEFAKVSDQLRELLASLEASTFVKRLKGASKKQMAIAQSLTTSTLSAFGLDKNSVEAPQTKASEEVAVRQVEQSSVVRVIQSDLEAYYQRKQDMRFKNILDQMKKAEVVAALTRVAEEARQNWSGRSIVAAEYWADSLDRWAEELVGASECQNCKGGDSESLPPEIVLKVMQILHDEMKLRDETREAEAAKPALDKKEYFKRGTGLALNQDSLGRRVFDVAREIAQLPNANAFGKELKLLGEVTTVMKDAYEILDKPDTGAPAIAAETEAIELLLQTRRQGKGGGGGGNNPGGGGGADSASVAALADIGPGADLDATVGERQVGQSTGKAGKETPEEFRSGLDAYFNALEKSGSGGE